MSSVPSLPTDGSSPERPLKVILQEGGLLGRWGRRVPWILFFIAVLFALGYYAAYERYMQRNPRLEERYFSHSRTATDKVAIITIEGAIMHNDGFAKWQIDQVRDDSDVKAVVVRVDSPGGTVTGSDYLYHHLKMLREGEGTGRKLPLVVSMGGIAASGGYYLSMAAGDVPDSIFAERTTWTGSIGVIIPHYNVGDLLENWNIKDDSVTSGPLKAMGSPTRKLTPQMAEEEHKVLQELVNQSFSEFKEIVTASRPQLAKDPDKLAAATTGQVFTGKQALELGLVDKLGFLEDAIDRAIAMANLNPSDVRVVRYTRSTGLLGDTLFGPTASAGSSENAALQFKLDAIAELATPRAYYLFSWLPPLVENAR